MFVLAIDVPSGFEMRGLCKGQTAFYTAQGTWTPFAGNARLFQTQFALQRELAQLMRSDPITRASKPWVKGV